MRTAANAHRWRFCVAPMMRYSHRHARQLWKLLCPSANLYTEMLSEDAILRGDARRLLFLPRQQIGVSLQLGGNDPAKLAAAAAVGESFGYGEINLNCGCPSHRVAAGGIGACLMATPQRVGDIVARIKQKVRAPVTVKCRLGINNSGDDDDEKLLDFATTVKESGADALIVHARRAWLKGLNPAQNRRIPPLQYGRVLSLKKAMGDFPVVLNGGLESVESAKKHLRHFDGVMMGRAIVQNPYLLTGVAETFFNGEKIKRRAALNAMLNYAARESGGEWRRIFSALIKLYHGEKNCKRFRRCLASPLPLAQKQLAAAGY